VSTYAQIDGVGALIGSAGDLEVAGRWIGATAAGGPHAGETVGVELA
jgi:hypothetical protein